MPDYLKAEALARGLLTLPAGARVELDDEGRLPIDDLAVYDKFGHFIGVIDLSDGEFYVSFGG